MNDHPNHHHRHHLLNARWSDEVIFCCSVHLRDELVHANNVVRLSSRLSRIQFTRALVAASIRIHRLRDSMERVMRWTFATSDERDLIRGRHHFDDWKLMAGYRLGTFDHIGSEQCLHHCGRLCSLLNARIGDGLHCERERMSHNDLKIIKSCIQNSIATQAIRTQASRFMSTAVANMCHMDINVPSTPASIDHF